jgi:hypothetical protein
LPTITYVLHTELKLLMKMVHGSKLCELTGPSLRQIEAYFIIQCRKVFFSSRRATFKVVNKDYHHEQRKAFYFYFPNLALFV